MDVPNRDFTLAASLEELKAKGRLVVHGAHRPILVVYDRGHVLALDNRCPHMGFPLDQILISISVTPGALAALAGQPPEARYAREAALD